MADLEAKDRASYTVYELLAAGQRFTDDITAEDAVEEFVHLHPDADRDRVAADLRAEIDKRR